MWDSGYDAYEVDGNDLYLFESKEIQKEHPRPPYKVTLKGNKLEISDDNQTPPYWVKLKKIADID